MKRILRPEFVFCLALLCGSDLEAAQPGSSKPGGDWVDPPARCLVVRLDVESGTSSHGYFLTSVPDSLRASVASEIVKAPFALFVTEAGQVILEPIAFRYPKAASIEILVPFPDSDPILHVSFVRVPLSGDLAGPSRSFGLSREDLSRLSQPRPVGAIHTMMQDSGYDCFFLANGCVNCIYCGPLFKWFGPEACGPWEMHCP